MLLLAPFVRAGGVWPRGPPWSCQGCIPPASGEKRTDRKKCDFFDHVNPLRLARVVFLAVFVVVVAVVFGVVFVS